MKLYKKILTMAVAVLPLAAFAEVNVTFDTEDYAAVGVYDWWEASPFRTGVLNGNCKVVDNPFLADENAGNTSAKVLGFQRSRHGSNMFGARIDLKEDQRFVLTPTTQYVHVMMYKPVEGRSMIIGLGRHNAQTAGYEENWKNQSAEAVQFTALATSKPVAGQWTDVVFPVKGAGNIDIYSLVVVVDCESAHERTEDFIAYIDDVAVNGSSAPRVALVGDYPVCVEKTQQFTRTDRAFTQLTVKTAQGQYVKKQSKKNVLTEAFDGFIPVHSGETFTVKAGYTGSSMHSFVYVDLNNNGKFDENELLASDTKSGAGCRTTHSITVPADLPTGIYRLRTKIDWQSTDPAGNSSGDNHILANGGGMIDVLLNVYPADRTTVSVTNFQRNGDILLEDGGKIDNYAQPQFTALKVKAVPENGFDYDGIRITHGYNLSGDSLVHSNPQFITYRVPRSRFAEDNTYTIPASYFDADVLIEGLMIEAGTEPTVDPTPSGDTATQYFTAPQLRTEAAKGTARIGILGVTSTGNNYITGTTPLGIVSPSNTIAEARAPEAEEVLEVIPTEGGYYLRLETAEEDEGYLSCAAGGNFSLTGVDGANVWAIAGPDDDNYGSISGFDDLYTDITKEVNELMVRFISNGQYLNGQGNGSIGGLRGGTGAWSFNYMYNANYDESTVGVGSVLAPPTTTSTYNLHGLCVNGNERGIRIVDGQKVLR